MYRSAEYTTWWNLASWEIAAQRPKEPGHWPKTIAGPYKLTLLVERPDNRRRDLANLEKALSDLLQDVGLIEDDKFCHVLHMEWSGKGNQTHIKLEPYDGKEE